MKKQLIFKLELNFEKHCWEHTATFYSETDYIKDASQHDQYDPSIVYNEPPDGNLERVLEERNKDLATTKDEYRKCKDCGKVFLLTDREKWWFKDRELQLPVRCLDCRKSRKTHKR
jgi:hypothetical protein